MEKKCGVGSSRREDREVEERVGEEGRDWGEAVWLKTIREPGALRNGESWGVC